MNALNVQGGGDSFANISERFGRRGQYGPCAPNVRGIATLSGLLAAYVSPIVRSVISSPSSKATEARGELSVDAM